MARAVWSGAISFGLVSVPVKAYKAVREHGVHFHQLDKKSGARVRYEKVSEKSGKPVEDIELGYERSKGRYVTFDPDEISQLRPKSTKTVEVTDFVDLTEIDPVFYDTTYWLVPDGEAAARAYRLLVQAMEENERVAIGTVVMRNKQHLVALRPLDGALGMTTMWFADEVVPKSDIDGIPRKTKVAPKEMKLANQIIDALSAEWNPKQYKDTYTDTLRDLIDRKAKGEEISIEEEAPEGAKVHDLMEALEASLEAARKGKGGKSRRQTTKQAKKSA